MVDIVCWEKKINTDLQNLTFITKGINNRVKKVKIELDEFNHDLVNISGDDNAGAI